MKDIAYLLLILVKLSLVGALIASRPVLCISEVINGLRHMLWRDWDVHSFHAFLAMLVMKAKTAKLAVGALPPLITLIAFQAFRQSDGSLPQIQTFHQIRKGSDTSNFALRPTAAFGHGRYSPLLLLTRIYLRCMTDYACQVPYVTLNCCRFIEAPQR